MWVVTQDLRRSAAHPSYMRPRRLPFADIEGDALSYAKLLRSLFAKGLEPPGIRSQIHLVIHWHLHAATSVHRQGHARLRADRRTRGGKNGRPVLRQPHSSDDIRCRLADARQRTTRD